MISAAVAIVLHEDPDGVAALFIHRAERAGDTWSGHIAFPGGRREARDADLVDTAIRETLEETGVDLTGAERLAVLDDLFPRSPVLPPVVVRPFVFAVQTRPPLVLSEEVQDAFWIPLAEFLKPGVLGELRVDHPGITPRVLPAYRFGKRTIWGMSERILTPLITRIS